MPEPAPSYSAITQLRCAGTAVSGPSSPRTRLRNGSIFRSERTKPVLTIGGLEEPFWVRRHTPHPLPSSARRLIIMAIAMWCNGRGLQGLTAGPPPKDLRVSARRSANTHRRLAHNEVAKADAIKQVVEGLNLDLDVDVPDEAVESVCRPFFAPSHFAGGIFAALDFFCTRRRLNSWRVHRRKGTGRTRAGQC